MKRIARVEKQAGHDDDALLLSVLAGFPDRVARRKAGSEIQLSTGISAELAAGSHASEFVVAVDIEDRKDKPLPLARMTARIEPEWLLDLFPESVRETEELVWDREGERVDAVSSMLYDELVIQQSRGALPDREAAGALLARKAMEVGIARFVEEDALNNLLVRIEFAGLEQPDIAATLTEVCTGLRSFAELRSAAGNFLPLLASKVDRRALQERAPESIKLRSGRQCAVHYEQGKPPWIASRLQDFFGMTETPRIGAEKTPVVVHLLAPNRRAVQTTSDLGGFWQRLYPEVRRELMRRYPRHQWPEKPQL